MYMFGLEFISAHGNTDQHWLKIFYPTEAARSTALGYLEPVLKLLNEAELECPRPKEISLIETYPGTPGIHVPEAVMHEAYITNQDISFLIGWETGRQS